MIGANNIWIMSWRLLSDLLLLCWLPIQWISCLLRSMLDFHRLDHRLWRALKDARSYAEWESAAEALNVDDRRLVRWKAEPRGPYSWDVILARTGQLDEMERQWQTKEHRDAAAYRELLMPVQGRDNGYITQPQLHDYLWTGTKTAIEEYIAATVRSLRTMRQAAANGARLDEKNEWFKARRMVLGRTALFLQSGSTFGLSHLGVMKALFENKLLPDVIVGTQAGALMAAIVCMRTDAELKTLFDDGGHSINLDAFFSRSSQHAPSDKVGWKALAIRLRRWWTTGKILDPATLEQCVMDNIGDMTFERAWQISGRNLCITIASDAPGTPNMLSWKTAPNVLIRTAALASSEMHPDKCLDMILEESPSGEIRPWTLNDETPTYRDLRRRKKWPSQKPPVWRVQELWQINHYVISRSRPKVLPFSPGTRYWAIHRLGTPGARLRRLVYVFGELVQRFIMMCVVLILSIYYTVYHKPLPQTTGLTSEQEEDAITPQRRCKPVEIVPSTGWKDLFTVLRNPTYEEIRHWTQKGEMATWPVVRTLHVRMDVERELHKKYRGDLEDKPRRTMADLYAKIRANRQGRRVEGL